MVSMAWSCASLTDILLPLLPHMTDGGIFALRKALFPRLTGTTDGLMLYLQILPIRKDVSTIPVIMTLT